MRAPHSRVPRLLASLGLSLLAPLSAAPLYQVVDLGLIPGGNPTTDSSSGQSVNNAGLVVGVSTQNAASYTILFQDGVLSFLGDKEDAFRMSPSHITASGVVAGYTSSQGYVCQGGNYTLLAAPSKLFSINNGGSFCGSKGNYAAYGSGTVLTEIMPATGQPAFEGGAARAINNAGQIVGEFNRPPVGVNKTGFFLNSGGSQPILVTAPDPYLSLLPMDINASGAFAGDATGTGLNEAFYCAGPGQPPQILPRLANMTYARVTAIADDGSIVGPTNGGGFLYRAGTMYRLTEIVDATATNWTFETPYDISPDGRYITGVGYHNGRRRGFLLLPPSVAPPTIISTTRSGDILTIDFKGSPGTTTWKFRGSTDLLSFPTDLNPGATLTEPTPGNYHATLNLGPAPTRYFLRIETP